MVGILREKFAHLGLTYSIGGQISFDVFPKVVALASCCQLPISDVCFASGSFTTLAARDTVCPCAQLWVPPCRQLYAHMLLWTLLTKCHLVQGWDKTYCLQFVEKEFDEIHFFGDKTFEARPLRPFFQVHMHAQLCRCS